jgi:hypothetical protein
MVVTNYSTQINISGTGFTINGNVSFCVTVSDGQISTYNTTADTTGSVSTSIPLSNVNGLGSATSMNVYASDISSGVKSNTVTIPVQIEQVTPTLSYGGGTVYVQSSTVNNVNPNISATYVSRGNDTVTGTGFTPNGTVTINGYLTQEAQSGMTVVGSIGSIGIATQQLYNSISVAADSSGSISATLIVPSGGGGFTAAIQATDKTSGINSNWVIAQT